MDWGAWRALFHRVANGRTPLSNTHTHPHKHTPHYVLQLWLKYIHWKSIAKPEREGFAKLNGKEDILSSSEFISQRKEERDKHKIIFGWVIYQAILGQNTKQYLQLIQTTQFCKFLSKLKSRFLQALKGNSFLNYWAIFSTPIELYNQTWSKHCTRKHNIKWFQQTMTLWTHCCREGSGMKMAKARAGL